LLINVDGTFFLFRKDLYKQISYNYTELKEISLNRTVTDKIPEHNLLINYVLKEKFLWTQWPSCHPSNGIKAL